MSRLLPTLLMAFLTLVGTGTIDLDVFVHHDAHEGAAGCDDGTPEQSHEEGHGDHSHALHCCAMSHLAVAPVAVALAPPAPGALIRPTRVVAAHILQTTGIFRPPRTV